MRHKLKTNLSNKAFRFNLLSAYSFRNLWRSFTACAATPTGRSNEKSPDKKLTLCLQSCVNKNIISKFIKANLYDSLNFYLDPYSLSWCEDLFLDYLTGEKCMQNIPKPQKSDLNQKKGLNFIFNILFHGSPSRLLFESICNKQVWQCSLQRKCGLLLWFFQGPVD